jgi:lactoylglutathione lyase
MTLQRVTHVGICVSDPARSLRFYRDLLGFRELTSLDVSGAHVDRLLGLSGVKLHATYLERDGLRIELLHYETPGHAGPSEPRAMNQLGLTHLSIRVEDLAAELETLRAAGVCVLDATRIGVAAVRSHAVFVTDPDGTRIELVESPDP